VLIETLALRDFGLYRGEVTFDLAPRRKHGRTKPIILFGGKNGAGKSTIIEAIRLCLYGRASLGDRVRRTDYGKYLSGKIHSSDATGYAPTSAQVALVFEHVNAGAQHQYSITRSWTRSAGNVADVDESLVLLRDNLPIDDVETDHWNEFIRDLVPPGLADLFFFDGEKIQRLAEESPSSELADSVRSLLGLNLVDRLEADLDIYLAREIKRDGGADAYGQVEQIEADIIAQENALEALRQRAAHAASSLDNAASECEQFRNKITNVGGAFASNRHSLETERAELSASIQLLEERQRELAGGLLPFAFCSALCLRLTSQLEEASAAATRGGRRDLVEQVRTVFSTFIEGRLVGAESLPKATRRSLATLLLREIEGRVADQHPPTATITPGTNVDQVTSHLSAADCRQLLGWIRSASDIRSQLPGLGRDLEKKTRRLLRVQIELKRIPEEDVIGQLVSDISAAEERRGGLLEQVQRLEEQEADLCNAVSKLRRQKERLLVDLAGRSEHEGRLRQVQSVKSALADYHKSLTAARIHKLEKEVAECFRRLCRKTDLVQDLTIDPVTFGVTLRSRSGALVPRDQLSAGEKQIFAVALLWALGRTSGRALPVVIDTPLARLDKDHRRMLFEHYFPHVSHQVIILSTDTEFDEQAFEMLRPSISHAYHLVYQQGERATAVEEGYFWRVDNDVPTEVTAHSLLG